VPPNIQRDWFTDIFFLSSLLFVFYLIWLGSFPLFTPDEGRYTEIAREMVASHDYITPRMNGAPFLDKPILYYWLQSISIRLFGIKEWALRLIPALLGIFGCVMTYMTGRLLFDRKSALLSALILATTPLYFGAAHYTNLDLAVAVFISSSLLCLITGITRNNIYFLYTAYLFGAFAFLTKGMIGIVFPAGITGLWLIFSWQLHRIKQLKIPTGLFLFALVVTPWYALVQRANPDFLHYFFVTQHITRFLSAGDFNNKSPIWFYAPVILIGFFPWTIFIFQTLLQTFRDIISAPKIHSTKLFLFIWFAFVFIFFSLPTSKIVGYILPVFPPLALLTGNFLAKNWYSTRNKNIFIAAINFIIFSVIIGSLLLMLLHHDWLDISNKMSVCIHIIAITLLISAIASLFALRQKTLFLFFSICVASSVIAALTVTYYAADLNQNSAKKLVLTLKSQMQPQDQVISYFKYYQDVPLYLEKQIKVVADWNSPTISVRDNWTRELWLGKQFQPSTNWLINEDTFWQQWHSNRRVFVFLNQNYLSQFKSHQPTYYIIGQENDIILLSNKPTI